MRVLHAIHDFLPRHQAGSEIYVLELCRALETRGVMTHVLCGEYDPSRVHGLLSWRAHEGIGVTELVNNWVFSDLGQTYASSFIAERLDQVLDIVQPDVLHVHNLLNLSFALPELARARGIPVVATLHDYTLVCPSGGQRVHLAEQHVCRTIDAERCARCFPQSPFFAQMKFGQLALGGLGAGPAGRLAKRVRRISPRLASRLARRVTAAASSSAVSTDDIETRLARARDVFAAVDLFVAPSPALGEEFARLGVPREKLVVSDYGFPVLAGFAAWRAPRPAGGPLRVGFVGTLVWHKGAHVLLEALALLPAGSCELLLFGDPAVFPDYSAALRRAAAGRRVRFMGPFARGEAAAVYAQMDVLVVPSLWLENSPLVIHEAFQAGVPVVGARLGGIPDLVEGGSGGLLYEAFSPPALAAALRRLIEEPGLLERLAGGLPTVKSVTQDAAEWEERYRTLQPRERTVA